MLPIYLSSTLSYLLVCCFYHCSPNYNLYFFTFFFLHIYLLTRLGFEMLLLTPFITLFLPVYCIHYFSFIHYLLLLFSLLSVFFCHRLFLFLHSVLYCFLLISIRSPYSHFLLYFLYFFSCTLWVLLSNPIFCLFLLLISAILFLFSYCYNSSYGQDMRQRTQGL
jgi:hypothetical protein